MNGIKKSTKNRGSQWYAESAHWPTQVTIRENVCSVNVFKAAHLFTVLFLGGQGNALSAL